MPRVSASRQQTDLGLSLAQAKGLKPYQRKQLQRLYQLRLPPNRLVTVEFAQRLGALTQDLESPAHQCLPQSAGPSDSRGAGIPF
jgi:GTP-binding protein HflX